MAQIPEMHLNIFVANAGHHEAAWRFRRTLPERLGELSYYQEMARTAERGRFDSFFLGDRLALGNVRFRAEGRFDPMMLLAALTSCTERIGLVATQSTTYTEPYNLARQFASLDHLSGGRSGWNIVTSWDANAAGNFGMVQLTSHAERYARATEYLDVVMKLWDSWEDDATIIDRERGVYVDTTRVHRIDHHGAAFDVNGPFNIPRMPQGRPLLVQAGSSDDGRAFAATYAEAIFTAQQDLGEAQAFYNDIKTRATALGRDASKISILPGLCPIIGSTEAEAKAMEQELNELTIPELGLLTLSQRFNGVDFSVFPLDEPVPLDALPRPKEIEGAKSRAQLTFDLLEREPDLTLRNLLRRFAAAAGHRVIAGTPDQVADHMIDWVERGAADGFNIMPAELPGGLTDVVDYVVPILQQRGVFRREYAGTTLREHYGLARPESRFRSS
jgi:FMN-dependent oxidoreductase (nitrilotriacetate monooxygenase family)